MTQLDWLGVYGLAAIYVPMFWMLVSETLPAKEKLSFDDRGTQFLFDNTVVPFASKSAPP